MNPVKSLTDINSGETIQQLVRDGSKLLEKEKPLEARPLFERAVVICDLCYEQAPENWDSDDVLAMALVNLAQTLIEFGEESAAREHMERALAIREAGYEENPDYWFGMYVVGLIFAASMYCHKLSDAETAYKYFQRATPLCKKHVDKGTPGSAKFFVDSLMALVELSEKFDEPETVRDYYEDLARIHATFLRSQGENPSQTQRGFIRLVGNMVERLEGQS